MTPSNRSSNKPTISLSAALAAVLLMFVLGGALGALASDTLFDKADPTNSSDGVLDFSLLDTIYQEIQDQYAGEMVDEEALEYGAAKGMTEALGDPYSAFFDPSEADIFQDAIHGTFDGIGAEIGYNDQQELVIIAPLPGYPADVVGLEAGDRIVEIDGQSAVDLTPDEAVSKIRGEAGTSVTLKIARGERAELLEFQIVRSKIKVDSVEHSLIEHKDATIGVLTISRFSDDTPALVEDAIQEFLLKDVDGVIVDLRNNPGGLLSAAIDIGGYFVGERVIVTEQQKDKISRNLTSQTPQLLSDVPVVVLVNEGSASASEILAGAIQDYDAGTIIGTVTFGKGSVQDVVDFEDGSILKITIARWLTPNGRSIEKQGIEPDITVELTEDDAEADRDPQMDRALSELTS